MEIMLCPIVDQLGHDLIDAYRHSKDLNLSSDSPYSEVAYIHHVMANHSLECPICKHNVEIKEEALQMAVTYLS